MDKKSIINKLKEEHSIILRALNDVVRFGIGSETGQRKLLEAKDLLIKHLLNEDENLYPYLEKAAVENKQLKGTLKVFADEMDIISNETLSFFNKYEKEERGLEFAKDFGKLFAKLSLRIRREESVLYDLFLNH